MRNKLVICTDECFEKAILPTNEYEIEDINYYYTKLGTSKDSQKNEHTWLKKYPKLGTATKLLKKEHTIMIKCPKLDKN